MKATTEDAIADGITSASFGAFVTPASTLPPVNPREFVRMAGEAVRGSWIIPTALFAELPQRLAELAMGKNHRTAIKASKLLIDMNAANDPAPQDDQRGNVTIFLPHNGRDSLPNEIA